MKNIKANKSWQILLVFSLVVLSACNQNGGLTGGGVNGTWQGNAEFATRIVPGRYLMHENNGKLSGDVQDCNENFSQCQTVGTLTGTRDQNSLSFVVKISNQDVLEFIGTTNSGFTLMAGSVRDADGNGTMNLEKK